MKYNFIIFLTIFVVGCSQSKVFTVKAPDTKAEINFSSALYIADVPMFELDVIEESIEHKLAMAPLEPTYADCGLGYHFSNEAYDILKDADIVYKFLGIRTEWIPIDGKPKEYFIFVLN